MKLLIPLPAYQKCRGTHLRISPPKPTHLCSRARCVSDDTWMFLCLIPGLLNLSRIVSQPGHGVVGGGIHTRVIHTLVTLLVHEGTELQSAPLLLGNGEVVVFR
jgi:hypothetical protein